jgi:hypothetical protein
MSPAGCGQKFRPLSVRESRVMGISLAPVHVSERGAVEKNLGLFAC